jgi:hypothetical protein
MNTFFRFLIPTIFISLGFIVSCNDDMTSAGDKESGANTHTDVGTSSDPPSTIASDSTPSNNSSTNSDSTSNTTYNIDDINPEDLSRQIKEIGEKINKLEQDNIKHYNEYSQMVKVQKGILDEIIRKKKIMRSKPVGSPEQIQAKKAFEDEKKLSKEKLKTLKAKSIFLYDLSKSIKNARNEQTILQEKQEYFLKKQKEKKNKN